MRKVNEVQDVVLNIEDVKTGKELKIAYLEKVGRPNEKIRLFCIGQEIANHKRLYTYGIVTDFVIITFFVK